MSIGPGEYSPELKVTKDGSHTLFSHRFDQHYHNPNGAITESNHVFFKHNGLSQALSASERIHILEVGFGTGLNLLLLLDKYLTADSPSGIEYHSIEAFPISTEKARKFNYGEYIRHKVLAEKVADLFDTLSPGRNRSEIIPGVTVDIFYGLLEAYDPGDFRADYIFHDPFSPDVNEELWTGEVFQTLKACSRQEVLLTTYCAASKAKGAMAWAGWHVASTRGALGKREMTLASMNPALLAAFDRVNEKHLANRYETGDF